ncbi:MAG TPA: glycosyl hydrolase [Rhizomicrobium sp.]|nr:glycosyl hydrolase [Rhizomicrobium sp.]
MKIRAMLFGAALAASGAFAGSGGVSANVMLGAHIGPEDNPYRQADFLALEHAIGRKLAIDNDHEDWAAMPDTARIRWDIAQHRLPMISWRVIFERRAPERGCATADDIVAGKYDAQLDRQARAVKALGMPILIRFNYEMTNNEENTCFTGFRVKRDPVPAGAKYIAAWKHVVDRFRAAGATNAKWVWAPGHKAYLKGLWQMFYPGSAYVDWIGVDDYNKSDTPQSFAAEPGMNAFYSATSGMGKPLMISETGANADPAQHPDPQTVWLTTARTFLKDHPAIKAFVWWDQKGRPRRLGPDYTGDGYTLEGPGLAAFKAMASDPYFQ